jgi:deoxyadenosine/deoxycytidine kinase
MMASERHKSRSLILMAQSSSSSSSTFAFRPYVDATPAGSHWLKQFIGSVFVVEGHIASGKTTFGKMLVEYATAHGRRAVFLPERFPEALLNQFIDWNDTNGTSGARNPYAFAFQMAMLDERQRTYREALALSEQGFLVIIDRSLPGDYVFASVNYALGSFTDEEWAAYEAKVQPTDLLAPAGIVHLDTDVDDNMRRIAMRARGSESRYKRAYMNAVDSKYREVLGALPYPIVTIPWGRDRHVDDPAERATLSKAVFQALEQLLHADRNGARTDCMRMRVVI